MLLGIISSFLYSNIHVFKTFKFLRTENMGSEDRMYILCTLPSSLTFLADAFYGKKWRGIKRYKTSMFSLRIAQTWSSILNSEFLGELQVLGD